MRIKTKGKINHEDSDGVRRGGRAKQGALPVARRVTRARSGEAVLIAVLKHAQQRPRPRAKQTKKNQYAVRFATGMAAELVKDLVPRMRGIAATAKRTARSERGIKQLDVNFSTPSSGLVLGLSLKSVHIREPKPPQRYTHNMKRNEEELRIEASGYHKRQPYAVMIGVLFVPFDSCTDGKRQNPSSFGSWVRHLRPYTGRSGPHGEADRFERIFVALYEPDGSALMFFDVATAPPKNAKPRLDEGRRDSHERPRGLLSYSQFLDEMYEEYLRRNSAAFHWDDGSEAPLEPNELPEGVSDSDSER